jgi:bile acid:Na+ symporter, BASS family
MLKPVLDIGVPALVILTMVAVGLGLTVGDFRRVARMPGLVVAATVGQLVSLPLIALVLVRSLALSLSVEKGMLLVAACPAGSMANLYGHLARANVALLVSLTAVSCIAALVTMPALMMGFQASLGETATFVVPIPAIIGQLLLTLILPILAGMAIRRGWPALTERHRNGLFALSLGALAVLIGLVIAQGAGHFAAEVGEVVLAVTLLTGLALAAGWATGWVAGNRTDRFAVGLVFVDRNVGVAMAVSVTVLGRIEFVVFASAYFLSQAPIFLAAALLHRRLGTAVPGLNIAE